MATETTDFISSEKTPLISAPEGESKGAIPKNHGSIEHPEPIISNPPSSPIPTPTVTFGPHEQQVLCPNCRSQIKTKVKYRSNIETHWVALLIFVLCWPCICLPYCCNSCKSANHYCPNCKQYLGKYNNLH